MLITELHTIGNNLYKVRKAKGLTQAEVAEMAELSTRIATLPRSMSA